MKHRNRWAVAAGIVALVGVCLIALTASRINWAPGPGGPTPVPPTAPSPTSVTSGHYANGKAYPIQGIDVSKVDGDIDWGAVANSGIGFAWIKATEGINRVDEAFAANWKGAKAAGVSRGVYLFFDFCRKPIDQVNWFSKNVPIDPEALPPGLDIEADPGCERSFADPSSVSDILAMLMELKRVYGKQPVLYIGDKGDYLKNLVR